MRGTFAATRLTPGHSLTSKALLFIAAISVTWLLAATVGMYFFTLNKQKDAGRVGLEGYGNLLAGRENARFEAMRLIQQDSASLFKKILGRQDQSAAMVAARDALFDRLFPLREDGTRRSKFEIFDGLVLPSSGYVEGLVVYIRDGKTISAKRKDVILAALSVVQQQGYRISKDVKNFFFITPEMDMLYFMPGNTRMAEFYLKRAPNDLDIKSITWFRESLPENNVDQVSTCSDVMQIPNAPPSLQNMTVCRRPVVVDGEFLGFFGSQLSHVLSYGKQYNHAARFADVALINRDGIFITEPQYFEDQQINGRFRALKEFESPLFDWLDGALKNPESELRKTSFAAPAGDYTFAVKQITLPQWDMVLFSKKARLSQAAFDKAANVFVVGLVGLLIFCLILAVLLRIRVGTPLDEITAETRRLSKLSEGLSHAAPALDALTLRKDEIGALARNFKTMAQNVVDAQATLHERIEERTSAFQTEKLRAEHASQAQTQFVASMSHELRTPLNAIVGFAGILRDDLPDGLSADAADHLEQLFSSADHLKQMVDDVLDFAQLDAGGFKVQIGAVDLAECIDEALRLTQMQSDAAGVTVHRPALLPGEVTVMADRGRLVQVLANLLSNAVKFNHRSGEVTLTLTDTLAGVKRIEVSDTGRGIAPEDLDRVFEPFERLHGTGQSVEGAGIGLSLSQRLVTEMGGRIGAVSELGSGSTFWVELPLRLDTQGQIAV